MQGKGERKTYHIIIIISSKYIIYIYIIYIYTCDYIFVCIFLHTETLQLCTFVAEFFLKLKRTRKCFVRKPTTQKDFLQKMTPRKSGFDSSSSSNLRRATTSSHPMT